MATLQQNINKAVEDFYSIKIALNNAGLDANGATAEYADKINTMAMKSNYLSKLIDRTITEIVIPDGMTNIGSQVFNQCRDLTSVTIPDGVTNIGSYAFCNCNSLININIPDSMLSLQANAFINCNSLTDITLPSSITRVAQTTFSGCTSLTNVTLGDGFNANALDLSASTLYSTDTLVAMLNALADRTGSSAYTLILGSINLAKLSSEQIAIATEKNWILA